MSTAPSWYLDWLLDPLEPHDIVVLRLVQGGMQPNGRSKDRLSTALLIARRCLAFDRSTHQVSLTERGENALAYYTAEGQ